MYNVILSRNVIQLFPECTDTPAHLYFIHTLSWVVNLFGIFFILAGHEHYSIDVFIAFYISTRLFLYYHTLANNRALYQRDRKRTRIWFPLFYFFESGVDGIVPNHFEFNLNFFHRCRAWRPRSPSTWPDFGFNKSSIIIAAPETGPAIDKKVL